VHITRSPRRAHRARSYAGASRTPRLTRRARRNERRALIIQRPDGDEIAVVQIAGLVARRIVAFVHEGDVAGAGERLGLIRFGSRVDVYLPPGKNALISVGQLAVGGETVLADLKSDEPERVARRS
jgi:phosphatidylserine decarboxylase